MQNHIGNRSIAMEGSNGDIRDAHIHLMGTQHNQEKNR